MPNPTERHPRGAFTAYFLAVALGMVLWLAAAASAGRREAWDAPAYWPVVYPLSIAASAALGYFFSHRPWRWPLALFAGQFLAMTIRNGEPGNLWPVGLLLFGVISLPAQLAARLAARLQRGR